MALAGHYEDTSPRVPRNNAMENQFYRRRELPKVVKKQCRFILFYFILFRIALYFKQRTRESSNSIRVDDNYLKYGRLCYPCKCDYRKLIKQYKSEIFLRMKFSSTEVIYVSLIGT